MGIVLRKRVFHKNGSGNVMERFIHLIKKDLLGEATPVEKHELNQLLQYDEEWLKVFNSLFKKWPHVSDKDFRDAELAYNKHYRRIKE